MYDVLQRNAVPRGSAPTSRLGRSTVTSELSKPTTNPPHVPPSLPHQAVKEEATRSYNSMVDNETLEDYSLRYAPKSFRKWSEYTVATTALGGIAYLADFAIGGGRALPPGLPP